MTSFWIWLDALTWPETFGVMVATMALAFCVLRIIDILIVWWLE